MSEFKPANPAGDVLTAADSPSARVTLGVGYASGYLLAALPLLEWRTTSIPILAASVLLAALLVALSAVDTVSFRLPGTLTLPLTALGLAATWWLDLGRIEIRAAAALTGYASLWMVAALYLKFRHREGLGRGDAKLFAAAGAWLGFEGLPGVLLYASLLALVVVALAQGRSLTARMRLPFGPFLAFAIWLVWLYGPPFLSL